MPKNQKKCFMENCLNESIYFCYCGEKPTFTCENHMHFHGKLEGDHRYEQIYSEIHEEVRKAALKHFYKLKSDLKEYQLKIMQRELTLINQIQSISQNVLQKLKLQSQKINNYIAQIYNLNTIDNSKVLGYIESILKLTTKDIPRIRDIKTPKLFITTADYDFKYLFILDNFIEQKLYIENICRNGPHTMKFIIPHVDNSILGIFDANYLLINKVGLQIKNDVIISATKCSLPDGSLFCDHDNFGSFLIDPELHIKKLPSHHTKHQNALAIYFEREIYIIEARYNKNSIKTPIKYSIDKNKWSQIAPFPIGNKITSISAVFKNYILIESIGDSRIFYYDTMIDSYNQISSPNLKDSPCKAIFVDNETVYWFGLRGIYKTIDNLITWNVVGDCSILISSRQIISYSINYNNKIYFVMNSGIYLFDLKDMKVRSVLLKDKNESY